MAPALPFMLTASEVGSWLFLTTRDVIRMARRGDIPAVVLPDGDIRFDREALLAWVAGLPRRPEGGRRA
jgi:hypothetical protein